MFKTDTKEKTMPTYFKCNNHRGGSHQVAYYHCQAPHDHHAWTKDAKGKEYLGRNLYICSNEFGFKGGHFARPNQNDLLVIFQTVRNVKYVITHVLKFNDDEVTTFDERFIDHPVVKELEDWPHIRSTKILCCLKPSMFDGQIRRGCPDLVAGRNPQGAIILNEVTDAGRNYVANGRIHSMFGPHLPVNFNLLKDLCISSNSYDYDKDFIDEEG